MCAYNRYAIRILHCNNFLSSFLISLLLLISILVATGGNINAISNNDVRTILFLLFQKN